MLAGRKAGCLPGTSTGTGSNRLETQHNSLAQILGNPIGTVGKVMPWQDGCNSITGQKQASQHLLRLNLVQLVLRVGPGSFLGAFVEVLLSD